MQLLEFVAELAHALGPNSVLDPWVGAPTVLAAAHEASGSMRSCGLVHMERLWTAAQRIAPLDWRLGDPLFLLRGLSHERFDLVLAEPPFGWRFPADLTEPDDPRGRVDISDLVLWRVAPMVADHGAVLFHTPDDFFWAPPRRRLWPQFAERGLYPRAVISVDPALAPTSSISTSLVLFTREARDQLFVGRLERSTSVPALVRNLVAGRTDDDPQLGVLTSADSFRGWRPLMLEHELGRMFGSSELRAPRRYRSYPRQCNSGPISRTTLREIASSCRHWDSETSSPCRQTSREDAATGCWRSSSTLQWRSRSTLQGCCRARRGSSCARRCRAVRASRTSMRAGAEVLRLPVPPISAQVETARVPRTWRAWKRRSLVCGTSSGDVHRMRRGCSSELEVSADGGPGPAMARDTALPAGLRAAALHGTARPEGAA